MFMSTNNFSIPFKEFNSVTRAMNIGLIQLVRNHLTTGARDMSQPKLMLDGLKLTDKKM